MVQYMTEVNQQVVTLHIPTLTRGEFLNTHEQHISPNRKTIKIQSGDH